MHSYYTRSLEELADRFGSERMLSDLYSEVKICQRRPPHPWPSSKTRLQTYNQTYWTALSVCYPKQMHLQQDLAKSVLCRKNGRRREPRYACEKCPSQPALCVAECFKRFHTEHYYRLKFNTI